MKKLLLFCVSIFTLPIFAQNQPPASPAAKRLEAFAQRKKLTDNSILNNIPFRNIGPAVMSGRVVDVDVNPRDPSVFYVCYASGGLWKTESNGATFEPLFDKEAVMTTGDVAVNWDKNIIWLGTGENNASRSSYAGVGMYKSMDGGKTWQHSGLEETHHIGRILLNPTDENTVLVAALGHLYSPNKERGVYKTSDGGKTWKQTLFVNENAGAIDIIADATNSKIIYAAAWDKERRAWRFEESGKGSGIYKSEDGGDTWALVSGANSGFPQGADIGRIGLASAKNGNGTALYATLDNQMPTPKKVEVDEDLGLKKEELKGMSKDAFLKLDKKKVTTFLKSNGFPEKYKADGILKMVESGKITVQTLYDFVDSGDDGFSNQGVYQCEVYRSDDNGKTWKRTHAEGAMKDLYFTYGYYFAQIRVNPSNPEELYVMGTRIITSKDGGKTWKSINKENVHWDHHALWINPTRQGHLVNGNDGGINISYNDGKTWFKCNSPALGQFYHVNVDMAEPYNVYGGLQDNGVWYGSSKSEMNNDWQDSGQNPFKFIAGGDGMQTMIDSRDNTTVYTGSQFGFYGRYSTKGGRAKYIRPKHDLGEKPLRFNWQTPILLSKHNQDVLYYGANKLYRSFDKGDNWEAISEDLTKGYKKGNVPFGTLTCIHESPLKFGLLYVGTDDGNAHVSKDGGNSWTNIIVDAGNPANGGKGVAQDMWVTRIQASAHDKATVYMTLNGYRWDDFTPYIYASKNYGTTWERIGLDLPNEPINVVKEDPKNANILYVGTDHSLYISLDKGKTFMTMNHKLPDVAVHDVVIHPRDNEIVVGTHGRSLYIADVSQLQQLTSDNMSKELMAFDLEKIRYGNWGNVRDLWSETDEAKTNIPVYSNNVGNVSITIKAKDIVLKQMTMAVKKGINYLNYDLTYDEKQAPQYLAWFNDNLKDKDAKKIILKKSDDGKSYLQKGKYSVLIEKGGVKEEKELMIE